MLNYGLLSGTPLPSSCYSNSSYRHVTIKPYFLREWMYNEEINYRKNIIQEMIKAFVKLKIVLPVEKEYTIDNVTKAVEAAQASRQNGKILLCIENNNNIDEAGLEKKEMFNPLLGGNSSEE